MGRDTTPAKVRPSTPRGAKAPKKGPPGLAARAKTAKPVKTTKKTEVK